MIRLLLGIAALGCLLKVFIGVSHNVAFNKAIDATPVVMSINDIVGHPKSSLPSVCRAWDRPRTTRATCNAMSSSFPS
jgi:hypothetical protein